MIYTEGELAAAWRQCREADARDPALASLTKMMNDDEDGREVEKEMKMKHSRRGSRPEVESETQ